MNPIKIILTAPGTEMKVTPENIWNSTPGKIIYELNVMFALP
jgi:hypothetical protein